MPPGGSQRLPTPCREVGSSPPEGGLKVHLGCVHSGAQSSTDVGATHEVEKQAPTSAPPDWFRSGGRMPRRPTPQGVLRAVTNAMHRGHHTGHGSRLSSTLLEANPGRALRWWDGWTPQKKTSVENPRRHHPAPGPADPPSITVTDMPAPQPTPVAGPLRGHSSGQPALVC